MRGHKEEQIRMCIVTISSRYQITIPKEIRERFDIKPGDKASFIPRGKTIEVVFARSSEELEEMKRLHSKTSEFSLLGMML
jgi:AbrB family looped-hinge helix DNA binding protein